MTTEEANGCVRYLKKLFPMMADDDEGDRVRAIRNTFLGLPSAAAVKRAIESRLRVDKFPDLPAIVAACEPAPSRLSPFAGPTSWQTGVSAGEMQRRRAAEAHLVEQRAQERAIVERLDAATIERLRMAALGAVAPEVRGIFERRSTLQSVVLTHLVAAMSEGADAVTLANELAK